MPNGSWTCDRCACEPLPGAAEKIITWRWREDEAANDGEGSKVFKAASEGKSGKAKMKIGTKNKKKQKKKSYATDDAENREYCEDCQ